VVLTHVFARLERLGMRAKFAAASALIFACAIALGGAFASWQNDAALRRGLEARARLLAQVLARALAPALSRAEHASLRELASPLVELDAELAYWIALGAESRVAASSEPALAGLELLRSEHERRAAQAQGPELLELADARQQFEVAVPIVFDGVRVGALRVGYSTAQPRR
jgi:hypothetical protein